MPTSYSVEVDGSRSCVHWFMCVLCVFMPAPHTSWHTVCLMACLCSITPALPSRRPPAQTRAKPPSGRAGRGSAKPVCKTEPGMENPAGEQPVDSERQWFRMWACDVGRGTEASGCYFITLKPFSGIFM